MGLLPDIDRALANNLYAAASPGRRVVSTIPSFQGDSQRVSGANVAFGARVVIPETGTLVRLAVYIAVQNGNIDLGIYDTTATTRNRLASIGSTPCPATGWREFTISLPVNAGDAVDFAFASDSASAAIVAQASSNNSDGGLLPSGWLPVPLGGAPKLAWTAAASFVLPATLSEASMVQSGGGYTPLILARY